MKAIIISSLLLLSSFAAMGQKLLESTPSEGKLYVGVGVTTIGYHIYYKEQKGTGAVRSGYFTPVLINLAYKLGERGRVQVGVGYGGDKHDVKWDNGTASNPIPSNARSRTHAVAFPVSGQFNLFNAFRRFPLYGTASLMPAFGTTRSMVIENGITIFNTKDTGMDVFANAGIGFNYRISNRFGGYLEYLFFKKNLTGENSFYYDWNQDATLSIRIYRSLALGLNYRLQ